MHDMDIDEFRRAAHQTVDWMAAYLGSLADRPVLPRVAPGALRGSLPPAPPESHEDFDAVLTDVDRLLIPASTHWQAPGFMAYFASTASAPGILGEMLAATLNANAMLWRTSPAATELEQVAVDWLRQLLGLPDGLFGLINDTASTSTLCALAAARQAQSDLRIREHGMTGRDLPRLRYYTSSEAHSSVEKAGIVLGFGQEGCRRIPIDNAFRMDVTALRAAIETDIAAGHRPVAVVATVGTTSSTSVDPVATIAAVCAQHRLWLHVDAAYAGSAALVPELRWVLDGAELADSVVVNPHKWLFTPVDCSVLWTRQPGVLRDAFSIVPEYLTSAQDADPAAPSFMDYGVALGRRFRALKLWMVMRHFGADGLAAALREHRAFAATLATRVDECEDFELMAPVPLSVVCLRAHPPGIDDESHLNVLNARVLEAVNARGRFFLSHTRLRGRYVIRVAFGSLRATHEHLDGVWDELRAALLAETS